MKPIFKDASPATAGAARERRLDAFIVSANDALLLELGPALGERFRTRPIERMEDLPADPQAPWIGFIDGARDDARAWIQHIEKTHARAALIIIADSNDLSPWQGMVFRGSLCAALGTAQIGTAVLGDALARAQQRLQQHTAPAHHAESQRPAVAGGGAGAATTRPAWLLPAAIAAGVAIVLLAVGLLRSRPAPAPASAGTAANPTAPPSPATAAPAPEPVLSVLELLSGARSAFRDPDRQLPRPDGRQRGDSALEMYAQVLAQEPANGEARDGLRRLLTVGRSRMQSDLAAGHMEDAQRVLAIFRTAGADPAVIKAMEADVAAALPRWLQSQLRRQIAASDMAGAEQSYAQLAALGADRALLQDLRRALDSHQSDAQMQVLADELHAAIAAGALLEPVATSARTRLQAMRQAGRNHPGTLAAQRELQDALLAKAREAQSASQYESAQRWLTAAAEIGTNSEITDLRRELQADMEKSAARTAATVSAPPPPAAPVAAAVTAPATAAPRYASARPVRPLNVSYPNIAAVGHIQGYVVLEFSLDDQGRASDIQVIESSPATVFDKAARDAVSRGRFELTSPADSGAPRRARLRVSFKPG